VDSNGFAALPLRGAAKRVFVGNGGNNANDGLTHANRKATLAAAAALITQGAGDQMLVAEGSTFAEKLPTMNARDGFSALYPTVYQSYDPAEPLNESRYGRATGGRPVIQVADYITGSFASPAKYFAIRGFDVNPGNVTDQASGFIGSNALSNSFILLENNIFRYTAFVIQQDMRDPPTGFVIRKNSFYGSWSGTDAHGGLPLYLDSLTGITVEDNIFYHGGWKIGASRDDSLANGGATIYRHSIYLQDNCAGIIRRNLSMDASATGFSLRGSVQVSDNVSIDNPIGIIAGEGTAYKYAQSTGVTLAVIGNAILGDADIQTSAPRGTGIQTGNGRNGSAVAYNLIARSRNPPNIPGNGSVFNTQVVSGVTQPSYAYIHHNVEYQWTTGGSGSVAIESGGGSGGLFHDTYDNNYWSDPASGTNLNISSLTMPNTYTASALYLALGYADKAAFVAAVKDNPELHPARQILALLRVGYAVPTPAPIPLGVPRTSFYHGGAYTTPVLGSLNGSVITASGLPSGVTLDSDRRVLVYDGTTTFGATSVTLTESPLVGSARDTIISLQALASPTLGTLSFSPPIVSGTPSTGTVTGYTDLYSVILSGSAPSGLFLNDVGAALPSIIHYDYDGTVIAGGTTIALTEYLPGAVNSPHVTTITLA
jgi:hypothetical protein